MKYIIIAVLALALGGLIGHSIWAEKPAQAVDPMHVILTQLRTHSIVQHERQLAIWYRACPNVFGKTPQIFIAWPAKLSYELELGSVQVSRDGDVIKVRTSAIEPQEPAVPTDFMDYLATTSIFTFANEQELVNHEIAKSSPIARYLSAYFLARDPSLQGDFARELQSLVGHLAAALGVTVERVEVEVPKPQVSWPRLPKIELCEGSTASVNGLPFAKFENDTTVPIGFRPPQPMRRTVGENAADVPKGIASMFTGPVVPPAHAPPPAR